MLLLSKKIDGNPRTGPWVTPYTRQPSHIIHGEGKWHSPFSIKFTCSFERWNAPFGPCLLCMHL